MKKQFFFLNSTKAVAASLLTTVMAFGLTACSMYDNPTNPSTDSGITVYTDNIDKTVRPGDDFYMYCIGSWWQRTEIPIGSDHQMFLFGEAQELFNEKIAAIAASDPVLMTLAAHCQDLFANSEANQQKLNEALARVQAASTKEELWKLMGELACEGYQMPFTIMSLSKGGVMKLVFLPVTEKDVATSIKVKNPGQDDNPNGNNDNSGDLMAAMMKNPRLASAVEPLVGHVANRAFSPEKWPMLACVCEGLGIDKEKAYVVTEEWYELAKEDMEIPSAEPLEQVQELGMEELALTILDYILDSRLLCDATALEAAEAISEGQFDADEFSTNIATNYMKYYMGFSFAMRFCSEEMKTRGENDAAELKKAFSERLANNPWLSEGSKANAIEKLDAMIVNAAYPEFLQEGIIDLSQTRSAFEDVLLIRKQYIALIKKMVDMKVSEGSFHAMLASLFSLTTYNAMYAPIFNSINLFPPFLMDPIYGPDASTAERYAAMTVFGHEITHGFDKKGAQWDKLGDKNSIWASEADAVEFDRRAQQLVDYYNTFEVAPGVFADGEKTLNENIADLGGVQLAFQALTNKLKADGLSDEAVKQQQRNFFVAYANLWRLKYTDEYAESMVSGDDHSQSKERVNGVVTNIDTWYDLFDVKPTDKMYLAPEKRIRIW